MSLALVTQSQMAIIGKNTVREFIMAVPTRSQITVGCEVNIVLKQDQRTGHLTQGVVSRVLTKSPNHPHGIKVQLDDGQVGRVKEILS